MTLRTTTKTLTLSFGQNPLIKSWSVSNAFVCEFLIQDISKSRRLISWIGCSLRKGRISISKTRTILVCVLLFLHLDFQLAVFHPMLKCDPERVFVRLMGGQPFLSVMHLGIVRLGSRACALSRKRCVCRGEIFGQMPNETHFCLPSQWFFPQESGTHGIPEDGLESGLEVLAIGGFHQRPVTKKMKISIFQSLINLPNILGLDRLLR
jgi:hypothetical protein